MKKTSLKAPAKINLGLSILRKLPNGYHEVKTIYVQISLFDLLSFKEIKENKIIIDCNSKAIPINYKNLVYQAAWWLKKETRVKKGIRIRLKKNIPVGSGLGGGSSDAAVVLKELNNFWHLNLSKNKLISIAKNIGADVAYHLVGGTQLETQGGEKAGRFIALNKLPPCYILLCVPDIRLESSQEYSWVKYDVIGKNSLELLIKALASGDLAKISANLHNDFELWVLEKYPLIRKIKEEMIKYGALNSLMSGKGSAVFGIFDSLKKAKLAQDYFKQSCYKIFLVRPGI
ncbi:4-(cytidine 5'-diphospho)-2-C-methyl-D-erythritol kinase [Candidatus Beckwithbacteria bacterium CG10_big_fil_rev_8_21_14_0_10_34_10]|uniref:4-diphosphocytidyl-2-C-methyl-D-erythritol kinase n=1 Tax=Candidatus Beckwithbacteria bacterium CG10_big_fil_rev_8_21_14_0_10_34_10 TaxID=1974495 RepID=A0A2H0WBC6_9BACT|nr:MAG: 4-(cytidine 5'-diphospho)-2-C-methyl-D-erythritol kinase [Candidatus Beckwithbacteria bacterium CG10_big_fil_rev_8_21_14_0_10_34_10]